MAHLLASTRLLVMAALRAVTYSGSYLTALLFSLALAPSIVPLVAAVAAERTRQGFDSHE